MAGINVGKQCQRKPHKGLYCYQHKKYYKNKAIEIDDEIIKKRNHDKKLEYYNSPELHDRLYGHTIEKPNENYTKPCLLFAGNINSGGYGQISVLGKIAPVHILSYVMSHGILIEDIPKISEHGEPLEVCHGHGCDKSCVEPTHLSLKMKSFNNYEDKIHDGTLARGIKQYNSKITEEQAKQIKQSKGEGSILDRSVKFGVSKCIVSDIDCGRTWSFIADKDGHVTDTSEMRKKLSIRRKKNRETDFTYNDWVEALNRLRKRSINSENIKPKVSTPCHLFQGLLDKDGYGRITFKGHAYFTHVLACEAKYFKKREDKKQIVRHLCDTPQCCNPEHLEFGTYYQNAIDAIGNHKNFKLDNNKVKEIKILLKKNKMTHKEIANIYNVSRVIISHINTGRRWSHVS